MTRISNLEKKPLTRIKPEKIAIMNPKTLHRFNAIIATLLAALYATWWFSSESRDTDVVQVFSVIAVFPNALLVAWLWRGNRTATTLAGFLAPFYFAHASMELFANPAVRGWVAIETFLSASLFLGAMLALRGGAPQQAENDHDSGSGT